MLPEESVIRYRGGPQGPLLTEGATALRLDGGQLQFIGDTFIGAIVGHRDYVEFDKP